MPACGYRRNNRRSINEIYIANRIGDAGQPYRIPLVVLNGVVGPEDPITTTSPKSVARLIN